MNGVMPSRVQRASTASASSLGSRMFSSAPGGAGWCTRGLSVGSSKSCGAPSSWRRHQVSCFSSSASSSHLRCHAA